MSFTSTVAWRGDGSAFGLTRYATDPLPWPLVGGSSKTQPADVVASHVQSRVVVIANALDIPVAGAVPALPPSMFTWHFELEGAVVEIEDDELAQAAARAASVGITNCRARTASRRMQSTCRSGTALKQPGNLCGCVRSRTRRRAAAIAD